MPYLHHFATRRISHAVDRTNMLLREARVRQKNGNGKAIRIA
jgi:hypothetical protein